MRSRRFARLRRRLVGSRRSTRPRRFTKFAGALAVVAVVALLSPGCTTPPRNPDNLCSVFTQRHAWYHSTRNVEKRWGVDQATLMAAMFQESSFRAGARPARKRVFGVIPWTRPSSAYGYAQALDSTWDVYRREARKPRAQRDRFPDAADFMGWYFDRISKRAKIDKRNAASLYLAYHEGAGGFSRGTHKNKRWLLNAADRVAKRTTRFRAQLAGCRERLDKQKRFWFF